MRARITTMIAATVLLLLFVCCSGGELALPEHVSEPVRPLRVALCGQTPAAKDFLSEPMLAWCEQQALSVDYASEPDFLSIGQRTALLMLCNDKGGAIELSAPYSVVADVTPPVLTGVRALSFVVGDGAVLREGVSMADDCYGEVTLSVDTTALDMSRAGMYSVTYRALDAIGNATEQTVLVTVYDEPFDEAAFQAACDDILARILPGAASSEQICRAVYAYVQRTVSYFPVSDHSHAGRAALSVLETGRGDCFSYFSLAKALLERAGVPCLEIERIHDVGEETHFWMMVDLDETGTAPRWYHFDPTELNAAYGDHNGCLFTDAQLDAYNALREGFYSYDRASYPKSATEPLPATGAERGH